MKSTLHNFFYWWKAFKATTTDEQQLELLNALNKAIAMTLDHDSPFLLPPEKYKLSGLQASIERELSLLSIN